MDVAAPSGYHSASIQRFAGPSPRFRGIRHSTERPKQRASSCLFRGASTGESCLPLINFTGITVMVILWLVSPAKNGAQFPRYQPARASEMRKSRTRVLLLAAFNFPALFQVTLLVYCDYDRSSVSACPHTLSVQLLCHLIPRAIDGQILPQVSDS
jgi:hypothetical protein